jgi:hypothetical protein
LYGGDRSSWPAWATRDFADDRERYDYLRKPVAYHDIYYHAAKAVRDVDPDVQIGGPSLANMGYKWLDAYMGGVLTHPHISESWVNFGTYHRYGPEDHRALPWMGIEATEKYGRGVSRWMCTEWNYCAHAGTGTYVTHDDMALGPWAISFCAFRLADYLRCGDFAAHHYSGLGIWEGYYHMGFFRRDGNLVVAHKAKTFRLMSKQLGLGRGECSVVATNVDVLRGFGAINSEGNRVAMVINHTADEDREANIELTNLGLAGTVTLNVFLASEHHDARSPVASVTRDVENQSLSYAFESLPPRSAAGILVTGGGVEVVSSSPTRPPVPLCRVSSGRIVVSHSGMRAREIIVANPRGQTLCRHKVRPGTTTSSIPVGSLGPSVLFVAVKDATGKLVRMSAGPFK